MKIQKLFCPLRLSCSHLQGIWRLRGPLSARKLLPQLPDTEGDPSPWQWAPTQLGPEEIQGSHLLLWAQDYSRCLHQSGRRYVQDFQNSQPSSRLSLFPSSSHNLTFVFWSFARNLYVMLCIYLLTQLNRLRNYWTPENTQDAQTYLNAFHQTFRIFTLAL